MHTTAYTDRTIAYAAQAGLRPAEGRTYRGAVTVSLNGRGEDATFGSIVVGTKTGTVLRATLTDGNHGSTREFEGPLAVLRAVKALVVEQVCDRCDGKVAVPVYDDGDQDWLPRHLWRVWCSTECHEADAEDYWTVD
jgi:hypothetical protein